MCQHATHTYMSQLSILSKPPGARPGCHTLFSSYPQAYTIHQYSRAEYGFFKDYFCIFHLYDRGAHPLSGLSGGWIHDAAYIPGLLTRTDRYLIWEANPKQCDPCHGWAGCITDWLTALTEKRQSSEAFMPIQRLLVHLPTSKPHLCAWFF